MAPAPSSREPLGAAHRRMVGRLLGHRYRVLSLLGEGGMGTVYLCEHAVLGRRFAVKVLRPELARDAALVERFRNEAVAASRIGQENVVDVVDFGEEDDGARYYVMEALEGRSLAAVLREEQPLALGRALGLVEQVCRALAAAHARGVVHRDVKPDNVFLVRRDDGSERAKVIDFGVSRLAAAGASPARGEDGAIVGTPGYMPPEQGEGGPVDARADVYAVGVLAFEVLTGTLPIVADGSIGTLVAHRTRVPDPPSRRRADLPPEVDALVLRALSKRPQDRHASMEALADDVAALRARLGGTPEPPVADRPPARRGPSPREARLPWARRASLAAAAVALAAAAGGAWWWRSLGADAAPLAPAGTADPAGGDAGGGSASRGRAPEPRRTAAARSTAPDPRPRVRTSAAEEGRPRGARPTSARDAAGGDLGERHLEDPYASGGLKEDPFE